MSKACRWGCPGAIAPAIGPTINMGYIGRIQSGVMASVVCVCVLQLAANISAMCTARVRDPYIVICSPTVIINAQAQ